MFGNVEKYLLTPVVVRIARKYIKDVDGAAASDLRVSISGGSVIFRNFELNLEEVVKTLPCSVVRTFARELHIRIPWRRLATDPIEVVLDTVECVFAEGTASQSSGTATDQQQQRQSLGGNSRAGSGGEDGMEGGGEGGRGFAMSSGEGDSLVGFGDTEAGQGWAGLGNRGWVKSVLSRALANVRLRVNNLVCKYRMDGAVASLSCESLTVESAGEDWEKGFVSPQKGLRKVFSIRNLTLCLDKLDSSAFNGVAAYQDPLLRTSMLSVQLELLPAEDRKRRQVLLNIVADPVIANVSDLQVFFTCRCVETFMQSSAKTDLTVVVESFTERGEVSATVAKGKPEAKVASESSAKVDNVHTNVVSAVITDGNREKGEGTDVQGFKVADDKASSRRGFMLRAALTGGRAIGRAWDFLVDEKGFEESQSRINSEQEAVEVRVSEGGGHGGIGSLASKGDGQAPIDEHEESNEKGRGREDEQQQEVVRGLEMFINAKLKSGTLKCRCDPSLVDVKRDIARKQECKKAAEGGDEAESGTVVRSNNGSPELTSGFQEFSNAASPRSIESSKTASYWEMGTSRDGLFLPTPAFFSNISPRDVSHGRARPVCMQMPPFATVELANAEMDSRFWEEDPRYISVQVGRCAVFHSPHSNAESRTLEDVVIGLYPAEKLGDDGDDSDEGLRRERENVPFLRKYYPNIPVSDPGSNGNLLGDHASRRLSGQQQGRHAVRVIWWKESDNDDPAHGKAKRGCSDSLAAKDGQEEQWSLKIAVGKVIVVYWPGFIPSVLRFVDADSGDEDGMGWWNQLQSFLRRQVGKGGGKKFKKGGVLKAPAVFKLSSFRLWTESVQLVVHSANSYRGAILYQDGDQWVRENVPSMERSGAAVVARTGCIKYWLVDGKGSEGDFSPQIKGQDTEAVVYAVQLVINEAQIGVVEPWRGMKDLPPVVLEPVNFLLRLQEERLPVSLKKYDAYLEKGKVVGGHLKSWKSTIHLDRMLLHIDGWQCHSLLRIVNAVMSDAIGCDLGFQLAHTSALQGDWITLSAYEVQLEVPLSSVAVARDAATIVVQRLKVSLLGSRVACSGVNSDKHGVAVRSAIDHLAMESKQTGQLSDNDQVSGGRWRQTSVELSLTQVYINSVTVRLLAGMRSSWLAGSLREGSWRPHRKAEVARSSPGSLVQAIGNRHKVSLQTREIHIVAVARDDKIPRVLSEKARDAGLEMSGHFLGPVRSSKGSGTQVDVFDELRECTDPSLWVDFQEINGILRLENWPVGVHTRCIMAPGRATKVSRVDDEGSRSHTGDIVVKDGHWREIDHDRTEVVGTEGVLGGISWSADLSIPLAEAGLACLGGIISEELYRGHTEWVREERRWVEKCGLRQLGGSAISIQSIHWTMTRHWQESEQCDVGSAAEVPLRGGEVYKHRESENQDRAVLRVHEMKDTVELTVRELWAILSKGQFVVLLRFLLLSSAHLKLLRNKSDLNVSHIQGNDDHHKVSGAPKTTPIRTAEGRMNDGVDDVCTVPMKGHSSVPSVSVTANKCRSQRRVRIHVCKLSAEMELWRESEGIDSASSSSLLLAARDLVMDDARSSGFGRMKRRHWSVESSPAGFTSGKEILKPIGWRGVLTDNCHKQNAHVFEISLNHLELHTRRRRENHPQSLSHNFRGASAGSRVGLHNEGRGRSVDIGVDEESSDGYGGTEHGHYSFYSVVRPLVINAAASGIPQNQRILSLSWESGVCEMPQAEMTVGPLDCQIDPRLLEELITVIWEHRRCGSPLGGIDTFPLSVNARMIGSACHICTVSSLEEFGCQGGGNRVEEAGVVGVFLTLDHSFGILHNTLGSDVRQWAGVHSLAESQQSDTQMEGGRGRRVIPLPEVSVAGGACQTVRDQGSVGEDERLEAKRLTPVIVPGSALNIQNFEFCVTGISVLVTGPGLQTSALVIDHADLNIGGMMSGSPVPITLHVDAGHLDLKICPFTVQLMTDALLALANSWTRTASMRMACAGPTMPTDDLRSGLFMRAEGTQERAGKSEVCWGDAVHFPKTQGPGGSYYHPKDQQQPRGGGNRHGWITWRYPFDRNVNLVTITGSLCKDSNLWRNAKSLEKRPVLMVFVQLSAFDRALGRFVEAAPVTIAHIEDWQRITISTTGHISAEEWLLSWCIEVNQRTVGDPRQQEKEAGQGWSFTTAVDVLKMLEVNPTTMEYEQKVLTGTAVVPFLRMDLKAQYMQVGLMERPEQGEPLEVIQIQGQAVKIGFHFWSPQVWKMICTGTMKGEFLHRACGTYETAVEPCHLSTVLEMRMTETSLAVAKPAYVASSSTSGSQTAVTWTDQGQVVGNHIWSTESSSYQISPNKEGFWIRVFVDGEMSVRVQDAAIIEAQRIVELLSRQRNDIQSRGQLMVTSGGRQGNGNACLGYTVKNECPVDIIFGQDGTKESVLLKSETSCSYTWAMPPSLHQSARRSLRIRVAEPCMVCDASSMEEVFPNDRSVLYSTNRSGWSLPFAIDEEGVHHRGMPLGSHGVIGVVVHLQRGPRMMMCVVVKPAQRIVNCTASVLLVKVRGFLPTVHTGKLAREPNLMQNEAAESTASKHNASTIDCQRSPESPFKQQPLSKVDELIVEVPSQFEESGGKKNCRSLLCVTPEPLQQRPARSGGFHATNSKSDKPCSKPQLSFYFSGNGMWSKWVDLPEFSGGVSQTVTFLVSVERVVEWDSAAGIEREVPAGLDFLWCQMSFPNGPCSKELTVTVWAPFFVHNGLYKDLEVKTGPEGGQHSHIRAVRHGKKVPLTVAASGVHYLSVRLAQGLTKMSNGRREATDSRSVNSSCDDISVVRGQSLYGPQDQTSSERERATAGLWSLSLRLLVWKWKGGKTEKKASDQVRLLVPGLGDHKMLSLTTGGRHHQRVPVILMARLHSKGVPSVVLSFLPQAVIHNHLPVPIRITIEDNVSLGLATDVDPTSQALFTWQPPEKRSDSSPCMAKIALVFPGHDNEPLEMAADDYHPIYGSKVWPSAQGIARQQTLASVWWLSPVNIEVKNLTCASAMIANQEYRAIVRTTFERFGFGDNATSDGDALRCCHVAVYPWALVSNMSQRDLYVGVGNLIGLGEPGSSLESSIFMSPAGARLIPVMTLGCGNPIPSEGRIEWQEPEEGQRAPVRRAVEMFRFAIPGVSHTLPPAASTVCLNDDNISLLAHLVNEHDTIPLSKEGEGRARAAAMMGPWSTPLVASRQRCRQRVLLTAPDMDGIGHDVMLTCTAVYAEGQVHVMVYEDPFPLLTITNTLNFPVEVCCSESAEPPVRAIVVRPQSSMDCDLDIGASSTDPVEDNALYSRGERTHRGEQQGVEDGGEWSGPGKVNEEDRVTFDDELNEEMWFHMKKGPKRGSVFVRVGGEEWLGPIELTEGMTGKYRIRGRKFQGCSLLVEVSRRGPTYMVNIKEHLQSKEDRGSGSSVGNTLDDSGMESRKISSSGVKKTPVDDLHMDLYIGALRLRMCDDERCIFQGQQIMSPQLRKGRITEGGERTGDEDIFTEIAVISIDGMRLSITNKKVMAGAMQLQAMPSGRVCQQLFTLVSLNVSAKTLQLDSFLSDSELPVVLTTDEGTTMRLGKMDLDGMDPQGFYLAFEACGQSQASAQGESGFQGQKLPWWIHRICLSLKPLILNVDDALVSLIERLQRHFLGHWAKRSARVVREKTHSVTDGYSNSGTDNGVNSDLEDTTDDVESHFSEGGVEDKGGWAKLEDMMREGELSATSMSTAPDRLQDFTYAEPRLFIGKLEIGEVSLLVTLRISRPVVLGTHRSPVILSQLNIIDVLQSPAVLFQSVLARYVLEILFNMPSVLGSLELLFNPTGLVKSIHSGLQDLVRMPLQGGRAGVPGFLYGLGKGGVSLVSHMSLWSLTAIAGFTSALSLILDRAYFDDGMRPERSSIAVAAGIGKGKGGAHQPVSHRRMVGLGIANGLAGLGQGIARGVSGVVTAPLKGAASGGGSGLIRGVGKGLFGAIAGPVSGALQLVAQTSNGIIGARGMMPRSARRQNAPMESEGDNASDENATDANARQWRSPREKSSGVRARYLSRSSPWRLSRIILVDSSERYHSHVEVFSAVLTGGLQMSPRRLARPVLLLTSVALYALEHGGCTVVAQLPLMGLEVDEDQVEMVLTIAAGEDGLLRGTVVAFGSGMLDNEGGEEEEEGGEGREGSSITGEQWPVQLYVMLDRLAWTAWLPGLRRLVGVSHQNR